MPRQKTGNSAICMVLPLSVLNRDNIFYIYILIILFSPMQFFFGQKLHVAVSSQDVFVGESFIYQIEVDGSDQVDQPDLTDLPDFKVVYSGGKTNNSQSVTIINGKMTQNIKKGFIFQYQLTPQKAGNFTIPPVMVKVNGKNLMTGAVQIRVSEPQDVADFKLRHSLSRKSCYLGESVLLTVTWYFQEKVEPPNYSMPIYDDPNFAISKYDEKKNKNTHYYTTHINREETLLKQGTASLGGENYNTLSFKKYLRPKKTGLLIIPKTTLTFDGVAGYRLERDFFFNRVVKRPVMKKFVISSNEIQINVKPLPNEGKPVDYSGLLGQFSIETSATPVEANVGDPITLTIKLKGRGNLSRADLPPLHKMENLARSFKIPVDMSPGVLQGGQKVFTQTIRALNDQVMEIPEISIPYFNTSADQYETARSAAIPIKVKATREFTMLDVEGSSENGKTAKKEVELLKEGISYNYEGLDVLVNQSYGLTNVVSNPWLLMLLIIPFFTYMLLLYFFRIHPRLFADQGKFLAKKAFGKLKNTYAGLKINDQNAIELLKTLLVQLKDYLGHKYKLKGSSLTYNDIKIKLQAEKISSRLMDNLKQIFDQCEAGHYASFTLDKDEVKTLYEKTIDLIQGLERS